MKHTRIIVTGAGGFLGSYLSHYFHLQRAEVIPCGRSLSQNDLIKKVHWERKVEAQLPSKAFESLLLQSPPSLIIHCAGTSSVQHSVAEPYEDFKQSVNLFSYVLECVRKYSPRTKVVLLSSASVYGCPETLPVCEDMQTQPISPYGYHKLMSELLAEEYSKVYGLSTLVLRIFSAYGEGLRKQVLYDLCSRFLDHTSDNVLVYGTGNETRDFIHISDLAKAIDVLIHHNTSGIFNIGSGIGTTIGKLAYLIRDSFSIDKEIVFTGNVRKGDPLYWEANIDKLASYGFTPEISIEAGVSKYCNWVKNHSGRR
ncbi:NAD-dependent epimerase/dehydratase family protein [Paenibacillus whitsoniae]|uniref:NAD-dependent epimerase/dehydratase family protein n=1 Tax=Paenibacillus whitsoniae TaxID=2496558 RepID=A0A3S0A2A7_9BACL|nr:NAD-dependent epimerase/dehydratase family protein [Paenibacillus whitsoniae]RTE07922.1 NAD-dependent epimerase/dehydratase family protein [Paenibacillus whitsoniae]